MEQWLWPLTILGGTAVGAYLANWWGRRRSERLLLTQARSLRLAQRELAAASAQVEALGDRLAAIEHLVTEALVFVGPDGTIVGASPAAMEWFELPELAAGGAVTPSAMAALRSTELVELVEDRRRGDTVPRLVRLGGRTMRAHATSLPDGGVALALRDETDLERLVRARRDLVANVSHDLRTPLTSIGLMVEALAGGALEQPALAATLVVRIGEQVRTLNALAEGMLDLDRLESGQALFRLRPERLADLVDAALQAIGPQVARQQVRVERDVATDLSVLADRPYAIRVLTNLVDNASRFSPPGSQVTVAAAPGSDGEADCIVISVLDEGPGIAPVDLDRIFERFYRSDRSRAGSGSGLGLAIARHIVEGHGGTIRAENRLPTGALFRFTLPRSESPSPPAPPSA